MWLLFCCGRSLESARWLLSQGRTAEATAVLCTIARHNGTQMPNQPLVSGSSKREPTDASLHRHLPPPGIDCAVDLCTAGGGGFEPAGSKKDVEQGDVLGASSEDQQRFGVLPAAAEQYDGDPLQRTDAHMVCPAAELLRNCSGRWGLPGSV